MNAIEIRGLVKRFGNFTALNHLDLNVPQGAVYGFLGPNGAGKTTALRIMTGLSHATSGTITIGGVQIGHNHQPSIGYLPDTPNFYNWMTAQEFLRYIADLHNLNETPLGEILERVGLANAAKKKIGGFSRGMKQRLGLAQALLPRPQVLLLDEPASALDPAGRREVLDILADLRDSFTVFFSTHILNDAERICDVIGIINEGELVIEARRDDLLTRFARPIFEVDSVPDAIPQMRQLAVDFQQIPWIEWVEMTGARLRLGVRDLDTAQRQLLSMLKGIPVVRFEMLGATLEDVFLSLTETGTTAQREAM